MSPMGEKIKKFPALKVCWVYSYYSHSSDHTVATDQLFAGGDINGEDLFVFLSLKWENVIEMVKMIPHSMKWDNYNTYTIIC